MDTGHWIGHSNVGQLKVNSNKVLAVKHADRLNRNNPHTFKAGLTLPDICFRCSDPTISE